MRLFRRVLVASALAVAAPAAALSLAPTVGSAATSNPKPTITATKASFSIPAGSTGRWILKLWTQPAPSMLVGRSVGFSGTVTVPVPQTKNCTFQVDVRHAAPGSATSTFFSAAIATVPGCGQQGKAPRLTPGFWKNHPAATSPLLPQPLGSFQVSTAAEATAVLQAMRCNHAVNCVAGHLLAAELDVANGSSICISGVIFQANAFLQSVGYHGPARYTTTAAQRATGLSLASALDRFTSDSTSASC